MWDKAGGFGGLGIAGCGGLVIFVIGIGIASIVSKVFPATPFCCLGLIAWLGPYVLFLLIARPWREGF